MPVQVNPVLSSVDYGVTTATNDIAVYFARDGERFDISQNEGAWTAYERDAAMAALAEYAAVADLTFFVTDDPDEGTFVLTKSPTRHGSLGYMNLPDPAYGDAQGIAWFNSDPFWGGPETGLLDPGSYTYIIFLHEFGHGLGLAHPFEASGQSTVMPSIGPGLGLDQGVFTVMTYNDGWPEAPEGASPSRAWGWNLGPAPIDIAVIQKNYGANTETATGNDTYVLPSVNAAGTGYRAIWDVAGADTIRHDGGAAALIDLRAATLRAEEGGGGFVSHVGGIHGGFTIANGVVIEDAIGGAGDDTLNGNDAANLLNGRGGADAMAGGAGDDTYVVDHRGDSVDELAGEGFDTILSRLETVRLADHANVEAVRLVGEARVAVGAGDADHLTGNGGDNVLRGRGGDDTLDGKAGADRLVGHRGDDVYVIDGDDTVVETANGGRDRIETTVADVDLSAFAHIEDVALFGGRALDVAGSAAANRIAGNGGRNDIAGRAGNDTLEGGGGRDDLAGNAGRDHLSGGGGADTLTGGLDRDTLTGGAGPDTFVMRPGHGTDVITDFAGGDRLDLTAFGIGSFAALRLVQRGEDVHVPLDDARVILADVALADLSPDMFLI